MIYAVFFNLLIRNRNYYIMDGINIELTTCCPLRCPQCYCSLESGKHIPLEVAESKILEAANHGVKIANLSGGETLCYPNLYELINFSSQYGILTNVALSGWHFTQAVFNKLTESGIGGIYISLNGSTEEINSLTRDGYDYAIKALELLSKTNFKNVYINWVMHSNNCDDFVNVIEIAEKYNVTNLVVLSFKPDSSHNLKSFPSGKQIIEIANTIKSYRGPVKIMVETCFSQLLAVIKDTVLFGNLNVGPTKGCRAGLYNYNINVDGLYSPCRHLDYNENFGSLDEYLNNSSIIKRITAVEVNKKAPCRECYYKDNCKPCLAVTSKLKGDIFIGHEVCTVWKEQL